MVSISASHVGDTGSSPVRGTTNILLTLEKLFATQTNREQTSAQQHTFLGKGKDIRCSDVYRDARWREQGKAKKKGKKSFFVFFHEGSALCNFFAVLAERC